MNKGILIYHKDDFEKNKGYINWLIEDGEKYSLEIELIIVDEATNFHHIKPKLKGKKFLINRSRLWNLSKEIETLGLRVFNNGEFCELGNDKLKAYEFIDSLGINYGSIYKSSEDSKKRVIKKPRRGHGGMGIEVLETLPKFLDKGFVYQEFIEDYIGDIRFYIIDNKITHGVIREPKKGEYLSNFTRGGEVSIYTPKESDLKVINKILENIYIDFGGMDFLLLENGRLLFNEFEDAVGSRMLSHLGINNTVELFLAHILNEVKGLKAYEG